MMTYLLVGVDSTTQLAKVVEYCDRRGESSQGAMLEDDAGHEGDNGDDDRGC